MAEWLQGRDEVRVGRLRGPAVAARGTRWRSKYAPRGAGAVSRSRSRAGSRPGKRFVEALELHSHVANIGDVRSLVIHPASTTHSPAVAEEQLTTGVTPGLVRLAVGIEHIDDILADLEPGFRAAKGA